MTEAIPSEPAAGPAPRPSATDELLSFYVEASPAGGYRVMLRGHPVPVSRHDTEDEARERMSAYARGAARAPARP